ncbi:MAG TPA: hypothetical protein ACFYEC_08215, partial [Candidatus Brocadiaceae bacterium]
FIVIKANLGHLFSTNALRKTFYVISNDSYDNAKEGFKGMFQTYAPGRVYKFICVGTGVSFKLILIYMLLRFNLQG